MKTIILALFPSQILAEAGTEGWTKALFGLAGGILATFLGFILNQYHQDNKEKIQRTEEYLAALQSAANEIEFYTGKLNQLSSELDDLTKRLEAWKTNWVIPSYSLYPDFLEKCKITINAFFKNPKLVKDVGHCHFELCHILSRLDSLKSLMNTGVTGSHEQIMQDLKMRRINCYSFKKLVDANILTFIGVRDEILLEKTKTAVELQLLKDRSILNHN